MLNSHVPATATGLPTDTHVDPLVTLVDAYFTGVRAYGAADLSGMSPEEEGSIASLLFGWAAERIENPEQIQSTAGALALVNYLMNDNEDWGQEAWKLMLSALREFLEAQAAKEIAFCAKPENAKAIDDPLLNITASKFPVSD
ncbi:hypothetical protein [Labrys sp. ZIDIC5]|uniref:hypothetical protein n=1 Tax=Labrys sedimenti TaxID=3106036 RepID=UPI002ACA5A39|nr:hypothetical protein [Labrys sp. ZIDIC5]MDZ5448641.1 hypothetical protein [Labrys sp. ZIDIC5]